MENIFTQRKKKKKKFQQILLTSPDQRHRQKTKRHQRFEKKNKKKKRKKRKMEEKNEEDTALMFHKILRSYTINILYLRQQTIQNFSLAIRKIRKISRISLSLQCCVKTAVTRLEV